jgi:hypothetical protein
MLPKHVEAQLLQRLNIVYHRLAIRRGIDAIRPKSLIKCPKPEDKFPVQERSNHAVDGSLGNCPESRIALDLIFSEGDGNIV